MPGQNNHSTEVQLALHQAQIDNIGASIDKLSKHIDARFDKQDGLITGGYVTKEEFRPVKRLVYGACAILLTAVLSAMVAMVIVK